MVMIVDVFVLCYFLLAIGAGGDHTVSPVNTKTKKCPNGIFFRQGCDACYCLPRPAYDSPMLFCESRYTDDDCEYWARKIHCEERYLEYNYNKKCEGSCDCKIEKDVLNTITTCEYLPCHNKILEENGVLHTHDFKNWPMMRHWDGGSKKHGTTSTEDERETVTQQDEDQGGSRTRRPGGEDSHQHVRVANAPPHLFDNYDYYEYNEKGERILTVSTTKTTESTRKT